MKEYVYNFLHTLGNSLDKIEMKTMKKFLMKNDMYRPDNR